MSNAEQGRILSEMALGNIPRDTMVINGGLFNVFTREFIKGQSIWVNGKVMVEPRKVLFGQERREVGKASHFDWYAQNACHPLPQDNTQGCRFERQKNSFP